MPFAPSRARAGDRTRALRAGPGLRTAGSPGGFPAGSFRPGLWRDLALGALFTGPVEVTLVRDLDLRTVRFVGHLRLPLLFHGSWQSNGGACEDSIRVARDSTRAEVRMPR